MRFITITINEGEENDGATRESPAVSIVHEGVSVYEVTSILGFLKKRVDQDLEQQWELVDWEDEEADDE